MLMFSLPVYFYISSVFVAYTDILDIYFSSENWDKEKNKSFLPNHPKEKTIHYCNTASNVGNIQHEGVIENPSIECTDEPLDLCLYREKNVHSANTLTDIRNATSLENTSELLGMRTNNYEFVSDSNYRGQTYTSPMSSSLAGDQTLSVKDPESFEYNYKNHYKPHSFSHTDFSNYYSAIEQTNGNKKLSEPLSNYKTPPRQQFIDRKVAGSSGVENIKSTGGLYRSRLPRESSCKKETKFITTHFNILENILTDIPTGVTKYGSKHLSEKKITTKSKELKYKPYHIKSAKRYKHIQSSSTEVHLSNSSHKDTIRDEMECNTTKKSVIPFKTKSVTDKEEVFYPIHIKKASQNYIIEERKLFSSLYDSCVIPVIESNIKLSISYIDSLECTALFSKISKLIKNHIGHFDITIQILNVPRFLDIMLTGSKREYVVKNKKASYNPGSFYKLVKINIIGNIPENIRIIDILPSFRLTSSKRFFRENYTNIIKQKACYLIPELISTSVIDVLFNSTQKDNAKNRKTKLKSNIGQVLYTLTKHTDPLVLVRTKNYTELLESIKKLKQLYNHLEEMKDWKISWPSLKTGIKKIYVFQKDFVSNGKQIMKTTGENDFEDCLFGVYKKVYKYFEELSDTLVESYNMYLRVETEDLLTYY
ncbi:hypothetical protein CDIK_2969 [Cucumispora dikerogammari]|nr:hypothetical protein CDIK_2969 [Cucumispora dikerogammari]